jgi:hypothetical protein
MIELIPTFAHGTQCFRCVVCGEDKARVALLVHGRPYGLCSTRICIDNPRRDRLLNSVLPRGVSVHDPDLSCAWAGVVHAAWGRFEEAHSTNNAPMRFVSVSGSGDPPDRIVDLGLE